MLVRLKIVFLIVSSFVLLMIMSCVKEKKDMEVIPCKNSIDTLGFEFINQKKDQYYPGFSQFLLPPIIIEKDIIVYMSSTEFANILHLTKKRISTGEILQVKEVNYVTIRDEAIYHDNKIVYVENPGQGYFLKMIDLNSFQESTLMSFDNFRMSIEYIEQITSNNELIFKIPDSNENYKIINVNLRSKEIKDIYTLKDNESLLKPQYWEEGGTPKILFFKQNLLSSKNSVLEFFDVSSQTKDFEIEIPHTSIIFNKIIEDQLISYYQYYHATVDGTESGRKIVSYNLKDGSLNWEQNFDQYRSYLGFDFLMKEDHILLIVPQDGKSRISKIDITTGEMVSSIENSVKMGNSIFYKNELFFINKIDQDLVSLNLVNNCLTRLQTPIFDAHYQHFYGFCIDKNLDVLHINTERGLATFKINY